ncbi:MAG: hypothetical protein ACKO37_06050 [Vampirovibrionales bacterium]
MANMILPDLQPIPFPAPVGLLKPLLVVGFFTHVIPMNLALGGALVSALYLLAGKHQGNPHAERLGNSMVFSLPFSISLAITQGIVPLLFLQLVYGPLYYTSSILMGVPWIAIVPMLLLAYYATYLAKLKGKVLSAWVPYVLMGVFAIFAVIGFFFTNNMTLMLKPDTWHQFLVEGKTGLALNLLEPTLWSRYLHFALAAFAVTGLGIGTMGLYWKKRQPEYASWLIRQGSAWYLGVTLLQVFVGFWFLFALPEDIRQNFLGGDKAGTHLFNLSNGLSLVSIVAMGLAWSRQSFGWFTTGLTSALGVVFSMTWMRHLLRDYTVSSFFSPEKAPVTPQWDLLIAFGILTVGTIIYLAWLGKITVKAFDTPQDTHS